MGIVTELFQIDSYRTYQRDSKIILEIMESEIMWKFLYQQDDKEGKHVLLWLSGWCFLFLETSVFWNSASLKATSHSYLAVRGRSEPGERFRYNSLTDSS